MKKSTIWILGVVMGLSFLSLLYLQISYIEEMVKMRNEQFDESVKRALMAASKDVESAGSGAAGWIFIKTKGILHFPFGGYLFILSRRGAFFLGFAQAAASTSPHF